MARPQAEQKLLQQLVRHAYQFDPEHGFQLASGQRSDEYFDCKQALSRAQTMNVLGTVFLEYTPSEAVAIGGLTMGSDPVAMSTSQASGRTGKDLNWFSVRKEPKGHGQRKLIEGAVRAGDRVVVVDDVVTTGSSTIKAIEACREAGLVVEAVIVLVDREQSGGMESIRIAAGEGVTTQAVFSMSEIKSEWLATLADEAQARFDAQTPEQQRAELEAQRQSWVRGEMGMMSEERKTTLKRPDSDPRMRLARLLKRFHDEPDMETAQAFVGELLSEMDRAGFAAAAAVTAGGETEAEPVPEIPNGFVSVTEQQPPHGCLCDVWIPSRREIVERCTARLAKLGSAEDPELSCYNIDDQLVRGVHAWRIHEPDPEPTPDRRAVFDEVIGEVEQRIRHLGQWDHDEALLKSAKNGETASARQYVELVARDEFAVTEFTEFLDWLKERRDG